MLNDLFGINDERGIPALANSIGKIDAYAELTLQATDQQLISLRNRETMDALYDVLRGITTDLYILVSSTGN